jgi:phosphoribosylanthranilate isomerase
MIFPRRYVNFQEQSPNHHVVARALLYVARSNLQLIRRILASSIHRVRGDCFVGKSKSPPRNDIVREIMTKIKICGIKTLNDALAAIHAGADYLGFNFYPKSVRFIEKDACAEITSVLMKEYPYIKLVGVFVNSPMDEINNILQSCPLGLAQLHGDETPEMVNAFNGKAFKAIRLSASTSIDESVYPFLKSALEPALLVDASVKGVYGGSGVTADWTAAAELAKKYSLLLAGGLTPKNVADAVSRVKPWGVDVASGVESAPGKKDAEKMQAFVRVVRSASRD